MAPTGPTRIQLCGRLAAVIDGVDVEVLLPGQDGRHLFAFLVVNRLRPLTRQEVATAMWPSSDGDGEAKLATLLERMGDVLGTRLELELPQLRLATESFIDVEAAREAVHRAEAAVARSGWDVSWPSARVALHTSRRTFLPGASGVWVERERERLHDVRIRALEAVAATALGMGGNEVGSAERAGQELMELDPFRESGYRYLIEALARQGNRARAVMVYQDLSARLRDGVGAEPSHETQELYRGLLAPRLPSTPDPPRAETSTMTFMFTDIVDSTALISVIGDEAWTHLSGWHDTLVRSVVADHDGRIGNHAGDGFFVLFAEPVEAVACAVTIQRRLASHRSRHGFAPRVRIGLHTDAVVTVDDRYLGRGVHTAARVAAAADGDQILVTRLTADAAGVPGDAPRIVALKGLPDPVEVVGVPWSDGHIAST